MDYKTVWTSFSKQNLVAVLLPEPQNLRQGYLYQAAVAFGKPIPDECTDYPKFLYGQQMHGSGNHHDAEADALVRETGLELLVPEWVTGLEGVIQNIVSAEVSKAYADGKAHGKHLVRRLAEGDMSVVDFEDRRS